MNFILQAPKNQSAPKFEEYLKHENIQQCENHKLTHLWKTYSDNQSRVMRSTHVFVKEFKRFFNQNLFTVVDN